MHFWWAVEGNRTDLGTSPGVSENPGVGLIGVLLQRLAERLSVCTCVFLCACGYACEHMHASMWRQQQGQGEGRV